MQLLAKLDNKTQSLQRSETPSVEGDAVLLLAVRAVTSCTAQLVLSWRPRSRYAYQTNTAHIWCILSCLQLFDSNQVQHVEKRSSIASSMFIRNM